MYHLPPEGFPQVGFRFRRPLSNLTCTVFNTLLTMMTMPCMPRLFVRLPTLVFGAQARSMAEKGNLGLRALRTVFSSSQRARLLRGRLDEILNHLLKLASVVLELELRSVWCQSSRMRCRERLPESPCSKLLPELCFVSRATYRTSAD